MEPLILLSKGLQIEQPESSCEIFISFKLLRAADSPIVDDAFLGIDEPCFQISHRKSENDIKRLIRWSLRGIPWIKKNGRGI